MDDRKCGYCSSGSDFGSTCSIIVHLIDNRVFAKLKGNEIEKGRDFERATAVATEFRTHRAEMKLEGRLIRYFQFH